MLNELLLALSGGSLYILNKAIETKANDWASILTDIIAVSSALGALALPISLNVIEATRSRYKTPSLLEIYHRLSNVEPQKLNRSLFASLAFALLLKLLILSNYIQLPYLLPLILATLLIFTCVISKLYEHLHFTYKLMSDISGVKDELIAAIQIGTNYKSTETNIKFSAKHPIASLRRVLKLKRTKKLSKHPDTLIPTLIEIEAYEITSNYNNIDIDNRISELAYEHLNNLPAEESKKFLIQLLNSIPRLLSEIETTRELDVYQKIAGLFLYILPRSLFKCDDFAQLFFEAERIARYREASLPDHGRFFRNGRIFLNCQYDKGNIFVYRTLFEHFKSLAWNAVYSKHEDIPQLIENASQMISWSYRDVGQGWILPHAIPDLWHYDKIRQLTNDIDNIYAGLITYEKLKEKFETTYIPDIYKYLKENSLHEEFLEKQKTLENTLNSLWSEIGLKEVSNGMEVETLHILGVILTKAPEIFIKCRELINPAGAGSISINRSPVPSSIESCIKSLIHEKNFSYSYLKNETLDFKIVDAIGALIIYELWRTKIFEKPGLEREETSQPLPIPKAKIRELKAATKRAETLETSFRKIISNKMFTDTLGLLEDQKETLKKISQDFSSELKKSLSKSIEKAIKQQPISKEEINRFRNEFFEDIKNYSEELPLFNYVRLCEPKPFTVSISYPREAFLQETDIHYTFNGHARSLKAYHDWMCAQILFKTSTSTDISSPAPYCEIVIMSHECQKELEKKGFDFKNGKLNWPNNRHSAKYQLIDIDQNKYFPISRKDHPVNISIKESQRGFPISFETIEESGKVIQKINYHIALHEGYIDNIL
ncbi:hypothetical protein [Pseudomonas aeruginosa]|uniref:hypothetical protein n=1 Tax=Pseudomonas aeruginosa TaxID=287 RepID=UPI001266D55E|nr:hypothetical protein [Pseudomonas aeruginosa]